MRAFFDPFLLGILISVALAFFFPHWAVCSSGEVLDQVASLGISLIFFFYGVKLNPSQMKADLGNWKLHLTVQSVTFLVFPILILLVYLIIPVEDYFNLWLGFFFLAVLPSTVSSSVVMVGLAKGNVPAAIFNASISGLIGLFVSPLWLSLFISSEETSFNLSQIYYQLLLEILLPVIVGLFLHRYLGSWANRNKFFLSWFDKSIILLIIYKSFARSFEMNLFSSISFHHLSGVGVGVLILFISINFISKAISKFFNFSIKDQITTEFCGTKKSLVHGSVFAKILLPASLPLGIILLPIMLYHALQLFVISFFANRYSRRVNMNQ